MFTFDEAKLLLAYEKGVRGVRILTIHGEENPRPAVKANDAFASSVMECQNLAGEALAPYFVCSKNADVADDFDIPERVLTRLRESNKTRNGYVGRQRDRSMG